MPKLVSVDIDFTINPPPVENTAPKFKTGLKKLIVNVDQTISYTLPSTYDEQGDVVSIEVSGSVPSFCTYSLPTFECSPISE